MSLTRREFLRAAAAAGALVVARHPLAHGFTTASGASPTSRLFPDRFFLAHADLHNHSHLSDGDGSPDLAFASMRDNDLDVGALTDHSTLSWGALGIADPCSKLGTPRHGSSDDCQSLLGIHEAAWERTRVLADAIDSHSFTAIRGFEWSSPFLGHVNVWFSSRWIDPLHTLGWSPSHVPQDLYDNLDIPRELVEALDVVARANPSRGSGMAPFYEWLNLPPATPVIGGGLDGIAGFNHPGRETGRFDFFKLFPDMQGRIVSMEIFNRREDYIFEGHAAGRPSPLVDCLNAGWRVGLIGVTDEHGTAWGSHSDKGRAGLWVSELSRAGVKEALQARRVFAARVPGIRLDASANDVRMGNALLHDSGPVTFQVDLDRGLDFVGAPVRIQVLRPGEVEPVVALEVDTTFKAATEPVISFDVALDAADGDWVVLRIVDPTKPKRDEAGPTTRPWDKLSIAYSSPFWLERPGS